MHFFGGTKSGATAHGAPMELLQFSRHLTAQRGRGLDSVTLYRGFYVEIDNSPDMDVI
jgi:hypothetical protein